MFIADFFIKFLKKTNNVNMMNGFCNILYVPVCMIIPVICILHFARKTEFPCVSFILFHFKHHFAEIVVNLLMSLHIPLFTVE